ncbi:restriction endonuclease subunit S [Ralstonia nicotianae]
MSSNWRTFKLEEVGRIVTGKTPKGGVPEFDGNDVPFVTPPDFNGSKWISNSIRAISNAGAESVKNSIIPSRSVLVTCIGSDMGKTAIARSRCVTNQQINSLIIDESRFSPEFIYYNLSLRKAEIRGLAGGSAQPILNKSAFGQISFCAPALAEQLLIVEALCPLDDRIALLREANATLEAIAQALFKSWFVDFDPVHAKQEGRAPEGMDEATAALFPDAFEESGFGLVPRGWRYGTLADLATYQNGYAFKTKDWQDFGHPVVKIGNVKPGVIDIAGASCVGSHVVDGLDRFGLKRGDLLVGMTGYVGETGLVPEIQPAAYLNQRVGRIATKDGIADVGFVYCLVRNPSYKDHAEAKSHGSAQANVSGTDLMAFPTSIPSDDVLAVFNGMLHPIVASILSNHERAETLATLRDTLLPRLISGQLCLPEAEGQSEAIAA